MDKASHTSKKLQRLFRVLGNPRRFAIAQLLLKRKELSVGTIASAMELSITATSKHLGALLQADILEREQKGLVAYYRINESAEEIKGVLRLLKTSTF